jgi:plasmid stabilization system protein ParE
MASFRLSEKAERELDDVWLFTARESGSIETATRVVDSVYRRFGFLAAYPYAGRSRDHDLRPGLRTFPTDKYIIVYRVGKDSAGEEMVFILSVVHASRDLISAIQEGTA